LKLDASAQEIINLMRVRFGNTHHAERYRAELYARRRGVGESAQAVYQDIRRLLALAFPGQSGEIYETVGREAFLTALEDPALRVRVLDQQPKTLDETLAIVTRMEAYSNPRPFPVEDSVERKKVRVISPACENESDRRIKNLEECIERQNQEIKKLKQQTTRLNNGPGRYQGGSGNPPNFPNNTRNNGPVTTPVHRFAGTDSGRDMSVQYPGNVNNQSTISGQANTQYTAPRYFSQRSAVPYPCGVCESWT